MKKLFPLILKDGAEVRDLKALKENFDLEAVVQYFNEGKLLEWLDDRFYDDEAEAVEKLSADAPDFMLRLCGIFGVELDDPNMDASDLALIKEKRNKLASLTDDVNIINNANATAFNQEELADLLRKGYNEIYLYGNEFTIPARRVQNTKFIGILNSSPQINIKIASFTELTEKGIEFKAVKLPENLLAPNIKKLKNVMAMQAKNLLRSGWGHGPAESAVLANERWGLDIIGQGSQPDRIRAFYSQAEKQKYAEVICGGECSVEDVLCLFAREDYSEGFAFTTDSFYYLNESGSGRILYSEVKCIEEWGAKVNGQYIGFWTLGWELPRVLKSVCIAMGIHVTDGW